MAGDLSPPELVDARQRLERIVLLGAHQANYNADFANHPWASSRSVCQLIGSARRPSPRERHLLQAAAAHLNLPHPAQCCARSL